MEKFVFKAKAGSTVPENKAQSYGERLYELMQINKKQELTAEDVVNDAKEKNVVYHEFFEWDDSIAAHQHRLEQARLLMRSIIKIKIISGKEEPIETRAFHCISIGDNGTSHNAYVPEEIVFNKKEYSEQVIENALDEAESWNNRYKQYKQLRRISNAIEKTISEIKKEK